MLKRLCRNTEEEGAVLAALHRFLKREGNFATIDESGDARCIWSDKFIQNLSPWGWWDHCLLREPEDGELKLISIAKRVLRVGVASSVNERVFSHWRNILGQHRTRTGKKRQREEVFVYSNNRVLKLTSTQQFADPTPSDDESDLPSMSDTDSELIMN